jgi:hypothetical protein
MQSVKIWAFSLCAAAVMSALIQMLAPKSQQKSLSLVVNLFLLLCLLSPLSGLRRASLPEMPNSQEVAQTAGVKADALYAGEIQRQIAAAASEKLRSLGIIAREVRIDIIISEDEFSIDGVRVLLDESDSRRAAQAKEALEDYLGLPVTAGANEVT